MWTPSSRRVARRLKRRTTRPCWRTPPMEPPAAVAEFKDGKVDAWTATQNPQAVQETVANAVGINKNNVICHVTLLGGGFGRKSKPDFAAEAALSKKLGKPVKVVWRREDDLHFDFYHSTAAVYFKAAVDSRGSRPPGCSAQSFRRSPCRAIQMSSTAGFSSAWASPMCRIPFRI